MTISQWQDRIAEFIRDHALDAPPEHRTLDLSSEVGELAKEILRGSDYGKTPFTPTPHWHEEIGDALYALICLANTTNVNLDEALENTLAKLKSRLSNTGSAHSMGR